ncbi:MAG: glycosyl hydrolase [Flavobacteriaceae bacterium]|nr:glycosyl hydrolase [Flavobacteriaceae bacterium]
MKKLLIIPILFLFVFTNVHSQKRKTKKGKEKIEKLNYNNIKWRNIGPFRGGRSVTSSGVLGHPNIFYMGTTGGGLWKTEDFGSNWTNISDGFFKTGTVGSVSVSESDPNIIVVGMGEHAARGVMTSMGDGIYISLDAGKTWVNKGLKNSRHISDVIIHPKNANIIYVSVQGAQYGKSKDRGIYKTLDGGNTWKNILFINDSTGASSLSMDMNNPRVLYASMWDHQRKSWQMISGGPNSGLYKSSNGGESWINMSQGLPEKIGKSGISVSRANSNIVYANIEAKGEKGGVYRSDNAGEKWIQVNKDRITIARSWYYMEIFADPINENMVYVMNAPALKSIDKGKTFKTMITPHGDNHHLWINPKNNQIMINSNDGGANVSLNGGKSWSTQQNQPTAQFYRVIADNQVPYHVYGGQQDNSAIGIKSRTNDGGIDWKDWYSVAGCESAFLAFESNDPQLVFGGCYQGIIERWDRNSSESKSIKEYPELSLGNAPNTFKYRYNWNAPIISSTNKENIIYHAGNVVFKTSDSGKTWNVISPDLTRNDKSKQVAGGAPFTNEAAGGENYNTITSLSISPHNDEEIWSGSDDGLIYLTKNEGETWENITPKNIPEGIINSIELSSHEPGKAYVVMMRYKFMDLKSYIYKTSDHGNSWQKITDGIPSDPNFTRVVRSDKKIKNLLYAGTETGLYISKNDGETWGQVQLNLPVVPINDLYIQDNDLIAATAGRSFWILDDLAAFQQQIGLNKIKLLKPKPSYRILGGNSRRPNSTIGKNPLKGVILDYYIPQIIDSLDLKLDILKDNKIIRSYTSKKNKNSKSWPGGPPNQAILKIKKGFNRFNWDLRRANLPAVENIFVYGDYQGGIVPPGNYSARISYNNMVDETQIIVLADPRINTPKENYNTQETILVSIENSINSIHNSVNKMREVQDQLNQYSKSLKSDKKYEILNKLGDEISTKLNLWERKLIQPDQKTFQDVINFNNQLNAQFMHLKSYVDGADPEVTSGAIQRHKDLNQTWNNLEKNLNEIINSDVRKFNELYKKLGVPSLIIPSDK